ncbi:MAG: hypothetical protein Kow009_06030 [Spirochaetales bacterium]
MRLAVRRVFLTVGAGVSLLFFLSYLLSLGFGIWIIRDSSWKEDVYLWPILTAGLNAAFSVFGGFGFRRLLQRMSSLEIYFFLVFLVTLSFDGLRVLHWVFLVKQVTPYFGGLLTRMVYFGYFMGLFSMFTSSIYSGEVSYQKVGTLLSVLATLSLALSYSMPVDITTLKPNLLYRVGDEEYLLLVRGGLIVLTVLSFARSALLSRSREEWAICGAAAILMLGREFSFSRSDTPLGLLGIFLLGVGSFYFSRKSYLKHLWI